MAGVVAALNMPDTVVVAALCNRLSPLKLEAALLETSDSSGTCSSSIKAVRVSRAVSTV